MRIEIFVVETEILIDNLLSDNIKGLKCLEEQKMELIRLFGGLTETNFKGFWCNHKTNTIDSDIGKIWLIYTGQREEELNNILLRIKEITKQNVQAYAIDNEIYCI